MSCGMPVPLLQYLYGPPQWPAVDARRGIPANSVKSLSAQHEAIGRRRGHAGRSAAAAAVVAESVDMPSELRAVLLRGNTLWSGPHFPLPRVPLSAVGSCGKRRGEPSLPSTQGPLSLL